MIIRVVLALALSAPPVMTSAGAPSVPCPVPMPARTSCGFLEVPERRDAPERKIKVGYAVHLSTAADRKPDPVVYMSGGPGSASMQLTGFLSQMFPDRDVVAVEQRGSRYSQPALACPETAQALLGRLRQPRADVGAAANRCRERLAEQGVDLRGYNTKEIAADVVALRRQLGYASWNLFGVSYSTRVMMDVAAADPEGCGRWCSTRTCPRASPGTTTPTGTWATRWRCWGCGSATRPCWRGSTGHRPWSRCWIRSRAGSSRRG
ncbi:alpha/beta fold hydrolase [Nonomuraea thailandensis]